MLSRDCDGCSQMKACIQRYRRVNKGEKVYCPDGTTHLVDQEVMCQTSNTYERFMEAVQ